MKIQIPKKPMFYGKQLQMEKADLALRIGVKKKELEQVFEKYGVSEYEQQRVNAAQVKRQRRAARRIKEREHE